MKMTTEARHPLLFKKPPSHMTQTQFIQTFSGIYEHSPWAAEQLWQSGIDESFDTINTFHTKIMDIVNNADYNQKMELIRKHPDLAGKAALKGTLTPSSTHEQSSAGLDQCSEEELEQFHQANQAYQSRFGFPFIMAVRHSNRYEILAAFKERLLNTHEEEFNRAMEEIHKIALFRLQDL